MIVQASGVISINVNVNQLTEVYHRNIEII